MDLIVIIILSLQITQIYSRKRKYISSDESIENFVYFKDCNHDKAKHTTTPSSRSLSKLRHMVNEAPRQPDCPFPRMCCALTCGNECNNQQSFVNRQLQPLHIEPNQPPISVQPQISQKGTKKRSKSIKIPPIGSRRDLGYTKEKIKNLISQDDDIRKILKDLVRVTMQKVDVMEMMNAKNALTTETVVFENGDDYE